MKTIFNIFKKVRQYTINHQRWSIALAVVVILGGYWVVQILSGGGETQYVLTTVQRGNIEARVAGSGQISTSNQVEISSRAAGELISIQVKTGQEIKAGALIAQTDASDALFNLKREQISHEGLMAIDSDDLRDAQNTLTQAEENLTDAYTNARISLVSASTDMTDVKEGLRPLFNCNTGYLSGCKAHNRSDTEKQYRGRAESSWYDADNLLYELSKKYLSISKISSEKEIESVVSSAREVAIAVAESVKYTQDSIIYFRNRANEYEQKEADEAYALVTSLVFPADSAVGDLIASKNSIVSTKRALDNARYDLENIKGGPDILDIRSSELSVRQKQEELALHYVRAPFDGIVASVVAQKGQNVNNGTTIATLITKQKIAEISLNEVDVAQVAVGKKALLTLDAIEELTIEGEVVEIDAVGTENQGVVTYRAKISLNSRDERIRSGMSVSVEIITNVKSDVLFVANSAIKSQDGDYVEIVERIDPKTALTGNVGASALENFIKRQQVKIGISNDDITEIVSGLDEGTLVITRTIPEARTLSPKQGGLFGGNR